MANLEFYFQHFPSSTAFSTSGTGLRFISIRKEELTVQVQTTSDAIIRFASRPDGSGSNFEVQIGVDGNMRTCIYESDIQRTCTSTPGILSPSQMRSFTITWGGGFVLVTHGPPILVFILANPFRVRFVGVGTR